MSEKPYRVAHVRPMPKLVPAKTTTQTTLSSASQKRNVMGSDPLKDPKQLYQMVSVNVNGVVKNLMVPVSASTSAAKTTLSSCITTSAGISRTGLSAPVQVKTSPFSQCGPTIRPTQAMVISKNTPSLPGRPPKYPHNVVRTFANPGSNLATYQATPRASSTQAATGPRLITGPGGKMILTGIDGIQTGAQVLIIPQVGKTGETEMAAMMVRPSNTKSATMPTLSASPVVRNVSPVVQNVYPPIPRPIPQSSSKPGQQQGTTTQSSSITPFVATVDSSAVGSQNVSGYLVGNQLVLGQPSPSASVSVQPNIVRNVTSIHASAIGVGQLKSVYQQANSSIYCTSAGNLDSSNISNLKIDSVFSLAKPSVTVPNSSSKAPKVIEISPDTDDESGVAKHGTVEVIAEWEPENSSKVVSSQLPKVAVLPDAISSFKPPPASPIVVPTQIRTQLAPLHAQSLLSPSLQKSLQQKSPPLKIRTLLSGTSEVDQSFLLPKQSASSSNKTYVINNEGALKCVDISPPPPPSSPPTKLPVWQKQTARKSTSKQPQTYKLRAGKYGKLLKFKYRYFNKLHKYFPMLKRCTVNLPRIDSTFQKLKASALQSIHAPGQREITSGQTPIQATTITTITTTDSGRSAQSKVYRSQGQNLVVTPTGQKTVIQPSSTGTDKGKFLMIKTNAGTFLVPVNQKSDDATTSGKTASQMKILSPVETSPGGVPTKSVLKRLSPSTLPAESVDQVEQEVQGSKETDSKHNNEGDNDEPVIKQPRLSDEVHQMDTKKDQPKESAADRIRKLKERLKMQQEEATKASNTLSTTKTVLETIDLV